MQKRLLVAAFAALTVIAAPSTASAAGCAYARSMPGKVGTAKAARAVVCLVNQERARRGLDPLEASPKLDRAATAHARRMASQDFFSHITPGGGRLPQRLRAVGWPGEGRWSAAESIGWGMERNSRPERIVKIWMSSPRDRDVLLSRRTEVGAGVSRGLPFRSKCSGATYALYVGKR